MLHPSTIQFLKDIKENNHKDWMDAHRAAYEAARLDFGNLVDNVITDFSKTEPKISGCTAKSCTFRFNRDIRFSKDKSPYKTNLGASINQSGKNGLAAGYYLHIEPGKSFCGGGLWMPQSKELKAIRQEIDYNWEEFKSIAENKNLLQKTPGLSFSPEYTLIREPKEYEKDNPAIKYLRLKSFIVATPITDKELFQKDIPHTVVAVFASMKYLIDFLNRGMEL